MSKSEMVQHSAQEQVKPLQAKARSTAEAQQLLIERLDRLAENLSTLAEEQQTSARTLVDGFRTIQEQSETAISTLSKTTEQMLTRATATAQRAEESLIATNNAVKSSSSTIRTAAQAMEKQARQLHWTSLALSTVCGLLIGMALLIASMLWQPQLIQLIWQLAHAIR